MRKGLHNIIYNGVIYKLSFPKVTQVWFHHSAHKKWELMSKPNMLFCNHMRVLDGLSDIIHIIADETSIEGETIWFTLPVSTLNFLMLYPPMPTNLERLVIGTSSFSGKVKERKKLNSMYR